MKFVIVIRCKKRFSKKPDEATITVYAEEEQYARAKVLRDYPTYKIISIT